MSRTPSPKQIEAEHRDHQGDAGKERDPPFARHDEGGAFGDHDSPFGGRRSHAEPDERQTRGIEDRIAHGERHLHHQDRKHIGEHLKAEDAKFAVAGEPRGFDKARFAPHVGFGARDPRIERKVHDRGREHNVLHGVAERGDDAHGEHEQRKRHDGVGEPPDDAVGPAAVKTGGDAGQTAHHEHQRDRGNRDAEVEPRCDHDPAEDVAPELVGAEPMLRGRRLERGHGIARERIVGNQRRPEQRREHDQQKQRERKPGDRVLAQHIADVVERRGETRWGSR